MIRKRFTDLKSAPVRFDSIWIVESKEVSFDWDCSFGGFPRKNPTEKRPNRKVSTLKLTLNLRNSLSLSAESIGIYAIYDETSCIYVGKTHQNIEQRFHAHVSKLTGTNVGRHHHPKKWQEYSSQRFQRLGEASADLEEFSIQFFSLSGYSSYLVHAAEADEINELEAMIYYGLQITNPPERFLNVEHQVGTKVNRETWKARFGM